MSDNPTKIRVAILREQGLEQGDLELVAAWDQSSELPIWIDISDPHQEDIEPLLEEWFRFHELAAEDAVSPATQPKYDRFPLYDFFVFRGISHNIAKHAIETRKLACFLGKNFLFTIHRDLSDSVETIWSRLPNDRRIMQRGPDFLLHSILDVVVDSHFPVIDDIEERMDEIHELIFKYPSQQLLDELLDLKRDLNLLRRHTLPQRELFNQLSRGDAQFIASEQLIYFRDLYDHTFRISESIDIERDLATSTMEAYLSVVANRTNDIMKVLTIISTVLLPMNFIAGIYGMNFEHMPELHWKFGYLWAFFLMLLMGLAMLAGFWKRGWLGLSRRQRLHRDRRLKRVLRHGKVPHGGTPIQE